MLNCDGVYTMEGLRLPGHSIFVRIPVTGLDGNTGYVLKRLRNSREGRFADDENVVTEKDLLKMGGKFQIEVMTQDGPVRGLWLDPRNCYGSNGRKYSPAGPEGAPLREMPEHVRRTLARHILRGGISYGVNDPAESAARLSWMVDQLPFEELLLFMEGSTPAATAALTGGRDRRAEHHKNLSIALLVAASEDSSLLENNPTLLLLLADDLMATSLLDSPLWTTHANRRKRAARDARLDKTSSELHALAVKFADPEHRKELIASLASEVTASPPYGSRWEKALMLSAVFDPDDGVRTFAAGLMRNEDVRLDAAVVLSRLDRYGDQTELFDLYKALLDPLVDDMDPRRGPVPDRLRVGNALHENRLAREAMLRSLPPDVRVYLYSRYLDVVDSLPSAPSADGGFGAALRNEEDPSVLTALNAIRQGSPSRIGKTAFLKAVSGTGPSSYGSSDLGLFNAVIGAVRFPEQGGKEGEKWVMSAGFDVFSSATCANVLAATYPAPADGSFSPPSGLPLPCANSWIRKGMVERLLGELANPDLPEESRRTYLAALASAAVHDKSSEVRRLIAADENFAAAADPGVLEQMRKTDPDPAVRAAARGDGPSDEWSQVSDLRRSMEKSLEVGDAATGDTLDSGRTHADPLAFRDEVLGKLHTYVPPRYHNGDLGAMLGVKRMTPLQLRQTIEAVRQARSYEDPFHHDTVLDEIIACAPTDVAVEAALASLWDPVDSLKGLVTLHMPVGASEEDLPGSDALVELVRRAGNSARPPQEVPAWLREEHKRHLSAGPRGETAVKAIERCMAAFPDADRSVNLGDDPVTRLVASRSRTQTTLDDLSEELRRAEDPSSGPAGNLPAILVTIDRLPPADVKEARKMIEAAAEGPARSDALEHVRERLAVLDGVAARRTWPPSRPLGLHCGNPVVNWHGEKPVRIHYEDRGPSDGKPVVLLMGQMMQLNAWPEAFVNELVRTGHRVVLLDNRDIGHSTKLEGVAVDSDAAVAAELTGTRPTAPYSLGDMADDVAGLLDHLGIPSARIVGQSMGGMIAQELAIRHNKKVDALVVLSSMTGSPSQMQSTAEAMQAVTSSAPFTGDPEADREAFIAHSTVYQAFQSKKYRDDARSKAAAAASWDRAAPDEGSFPRQLAAIYASGDRTEALAAAAATRGPGFVTFVHGTDDTLICPQAAESAHRRVRGSQLHMVPDMGHDLPDELCEEVARIVTDMPAIWNPPRGREWED